MAKRSRQTQAKTQAHLTASEFNHPAIAVVVFLRLGGVSQISLDCIEEAASERVEQLLLLRLAESVAFEQVAQRSEDRAMVARACALYRLPVTVQESSLGLRKNARQEVTRSKQR